MHLKELDSLGLLKLCAADTSNDAAWREFVGRFSQKIKTYLMRSCWHARRQGNELSSQISSLPEQEVDDLAQQLWLRLVARDCWLLKQFSGQTEEEFCAYLADLAASLAHNHYRNLCRTKRPRIAGPLEDLLAAGTERCPREPAGSEVEASFYAKERIAQLHHLVRALYSHPADADRADAIFTLYFCQGCTADEISKFPGVNLSRPSVSRIIVIIRRGLAPYATDQERKK